MESYLKTWKSMGRMSNRDFSNFLQTGQVRMKNSLKSDDDTKDKVDSKETSSDSLPIHCVIQTINSLDDLKTMTCTNCRGRDKKNGENLWECDCNKNEMSGCVVIPEDTPMNDLVSTVLLKLGYPSSASAFATGSIVIRNWKPLPLETICPGMKNTVSDILGELTAIVSLRIQFLWPKISALQKIKDNLLNFLIKTNQNLLRESGCPFDLDTLYNFCNHNNCPRKQLQQEPSEDLLRKFSVWLKNHQDIEKQTANLNSSISDPTKAIPLTVNGGTRISCEDIKPDAVKNQTNASMNESFKSSSFTVMERLKNSVPKTRVRTSFDPEFELPKLHKWYSENPHPSRQQIYDYVVELNSLESRKGRKQLDVNNVVYWFKNARAAQKRTECRKVPNLQSSGNNRDNVLKIPLGKNSGGTSDDQKSISEDEASATSESGEDEYRQDNGRCLQVVGKWNSNGQGEAVLEMQIAARKNDFVQSIAQPKKEKMIDDEETSKSEILSTDEDSIGKISLPNKKVTPLGDPENNIQKKNQAINVIENIKNERKSDEVENNGRQGNGGTKDEVLTPKIQLRNNLVQYKENNGVNNNSFLSPYKPGFPVPPNSILGHSFIYMSQYMNSKPSNLPLSSEEKRKRNRTFIDPVTEVPRLEQWFRLSTHPSHNLITRYTEELNNMPYRRKFPKLEAKNVQFWFKNRRAKNKRLNHLETNNN